MNHCVSKQFLYWLRESSTKTKGSVLSWLVYVKTIDCWALSVPPRIKWRRSGLILALFHLVIASQSSLTTPKTQWRWDETERKDAKTGMRLQWIGALGWEKNCPWRKYLLYCSATCFHHPRTVLKPLIDNKSNNWGTHVHSFSSFELDL